MTATAGEPAPVDVTEIAGNVVESSRGEYDGEVRLSAPSELLVTTHRRVVETILAEPVENALVHNGEDPTVEVTVSEDPRAGAVLSVADDGPGIPARERKVLESGTETQLEHGQGIGLWLVTWAVTQLGGALSFSEREPSGSIVTVRLSDVGTGS
jgi:signal transduction histidine kinase